MTEEYVLILEVIAVSLSINFLSHTVSSLLGGCNWKQCHKNLSRVPIFSLQVSHIFGRHLIALVLISSTWTLNNIWACMVQLKSGPSITLTLSFNPRHCMTHSHWWIFLIFRTNSRIFSIINHFRVILCKFVEHCRVLLLISPPVLLRSNFHSWEKYSPLPTDCRLASLSFLDMVHALNVQH